MIRGYPTYAVFERKRENLTLIIHLFINHMYRLYQLSYLHNSEQSLKSLLNESTQHGFKLKLRARTQVHSSRHNLNQIGKFGAGRDKTVTNFANEIKGTTETQDCDTEIHGHRAGRTTSKDKLWRTWCSSASVDSYLEKRNPSIDIDWYSQNTEAIDRCNVLFQATIDRHCSQAPIFHVSICHQIIRASLLYRKKITESNTQCSL